MPKAKLFMNGGSQAVRLPAEFRFEGHEVDIRRNERGEVVLSQKKKFDVDEFIAFLETLNVPEDFMEDREQTMEDFRDPFVHD